MTEKKTYRMMFTGDIVMSAERKTPGFVESLIASFEADCVIGNSEIPLTERGTRAAKFVAWRASPSLARQMQVLGFDIVTLANNHALDYGHEGLADTLAAFHGAGVQTVGAGKDADTAFSPALVTFDAATKVAILSVASTLPLGFAATADHPGVAPIRVSTQYEFDPMDVQDEPGCLPTFIHTQANTADVERLCQDIRALKEEGYLVLVSIHWGNAFQKQLAQYQQPLAHALEQAGCELVIGHHPHTIHGIEVIRRMPVLYSLGNFIVEKKAVEHGESDLPSGLATQWTMSPEALIALVEITNGEIISVDLIPILLDADGFPSRADSAVSERILNDTETYPPGPIGWKREHDSAVLRFQ